MITSNLLLQVTYILYIIVSFCFIIIDDRIARKEVDAQKVYDD